MVPITLNRYKSTFFRYYDSRGNINIKRMLHSVTLCVHRLSCWLFITVLYVGKEEFEGLTLVEKWT